MSTDGNHDVKGHDASPLSRAPLTALTEMEMPEGAPEATRCIRWERPEPGLIELVLDPPHRSSTVLDAPMLRDLELAVNKLSREIGVRGIVIRGRDPLHFAFGADLAMIESASNAMEVEAAIRATHAVFAELSRLYPRTVAAVGGPVPGGAFELSLACDHIIAADHPSTRVGLPEVKLGILPGWGGTHRLPKRIGLVAALPLLLEGKLLPARAAQKRGLVDRLAHPDDLVRIARDVALGRTTLKRKRSIARRWLVDRNPLARWVIESKAEKAVLSKTHGHYPAPLTLLPIAVDAVGTSLTDAAAMEASAGGKLATGSVSKALISLFKGSEAQKRLGREADGSRPAKPVVGGVVGGGIMGGAIASLMAEKGTSMRLSDLSTEVLDAALVTHQAEIAKKKRRRRLKPHEADAALDRLDTCTDLTGFERADVVVEAVAERMDVKRAVFQSLAERCSDETLLCTNTSSLSVAELAQEVPRPERFVGLHFFNPVRLMPLVEVIPHEGTSQSSVTRACALALALGKTPVVVKDVAGFLVNRVLGPYLDEALRLFQGGVSAGRLDHLLEHKGMPMGPLRLLDEVGFDVAAHAAESLHTAYGDRMTPSTCVKTLINEGRLGKKSGRGFYEHAGKAPQLATDLGRLKASMDLDSLYDHAVVERCLYALVNESARCLGEGVVGSAAELDLAVVMGTGFLPWSGGPLRWADSIGVARVVERLREIAQEPDVTYRGGSGRFEPAELLVRAAETGTCLVDATPLSAEAVGAES